LSVPPALVREVLLQPTKAFELPSAWGGAISLGAVQLAYEGWLLVVVYAAMGIGASCRRTAA
jgi:hypothetical protein